LGCLGRNGPEHNEKTVSGIGEQPKDVVSGKPGLLGGNGSLPESLRITLPLKDKYPVNFSGQWVFNEDKSDIGKTGTGNVAYKMEVEQDDDLLTVKKYSIVEWGDDRTTNETILLDGSEMKSVFFNSPRISKANWDEVSKSVKISSTVKFTRGGQTTEMKSSEDWSLQESGKVLKIVQTSTGFSGGETTVSLIYNKQ